MALGRNTNLGAVLLVGAVAQWTHVGALLRRFGYQVVELAAVPQSLSVEDRERHEIQLVILDEATCLGGEVDVVTLLLGMLSLATILIVRRAAAEDDARRAPPERCRYLAPSFSPLDLTQAIVGSLQQRVHHAN